MTGESRFTDSTAKTAGKEAPAPNWQEAAMIPRSAGPIPPQPLRRVRRLAKVSAVCSLALWAVATLLFVAAPIVGPTAAATPDLRKENDANFCSRADLHSVPDPFADTDGTVAQIVAVVVEAGTKIRVAPDDNAREADKLDFSTPLDIIARKQHDWLRVARWGGHGMPIGWVHANDLLCGNRPLADPDTGLDRNAQIKADGGMDRTASVVVHAASSGSGCRIDRASTCRVLSRFDIEFILAERDGRVLLSPFYRTNLTRDPLTGWVPQDRILRWNTGLGLRPSEKLKDTDSICAFGSIEDARDGWNCIPISGGPHWFQTGNRLLLLQQLPSLYQVAAAGLTAPANQANQRTGSLLYIRKESAVSIDVRVSAEQLSSWIGLLKQIGDVRLPSTGGGAAFANVLVDAVARQLGVLINTTGDPLAMFVQQKGGLPLGDRSPSMSYSLNDLVKVREPLQACEVSILQRWFRSTMAFLSIVERGEFYPDYSLADVQAGCVLSENGKRVPLIGSAAIARRLGPDPSYSFMQKRALERTVYYWIPQQYMP